MAMALFARETSAFLEKEIGRSVRMAIILGSGLNSVVRDLPTDQIIPYKDIPGFPAVGVKGHAGNLHIGVVTGVPCALFAGRVHYYEGHRMAQVAFPVIVAHALGAQIVLVTNAAGGIHPALQTGAFMLIRDQINLMGSSPLIGLTPSERVTPFADMSRAYSQRLRQLARSVFREQGENVFEGVLAAVCGPAYETPAEIRMLRALGADAVCMSTVPEVIMARALNMEVLGISCITNRAAGLQEAPLSHEEVMRAGAAQVRSLASVLQGVLARLARILNERS